MAICLVGINSDVSNCLHLILFAVAGLKFQFHNLFVYPPLPSDVLL